MTPAATALASALFALGAALLLLGVVVKRADDTAAWWAEMTHQEEDE
jgi:hypothetical protein